MGVLLEAKSLKKTQYRFKNFKWDKNLSVKNVSLYVNEGEIVGMLGPNGAGKSTSLKMITGDLTPDEGHRHYADAGIYKTGMPRPLRRTHGAV